MGRSIVTTDALRAALALCVLACASGCDGRDQDDLLIYTPPSTIPRPVADMGAVLPDMPVDAECVGVNVGGRCALINATGVCVGGACQLVACVEGFRDCNGRPEDGCERDITTVLDCGACERACREGQTCQAGASGQVCSSGVVCPVGSFDLDQQASCEWSFADATLAEPQPLGRFEVDLARLLSDDSLILAGAGANGRFIDGPRADGALMALPVAEPTPTERARDFEILETPGVEEGAAPTARIAVVWGQDVSVSTFTEGAEPTHAFITRTGEGEEPVVPRGVGVLGAEFVVAFDDRVVVERDGDASLEFGSAEYLAAFFPQVDPMTCADACPAFEPRDVFSVGSAVIVLTRTGLVVLREDEAQGALSALGHLEDPEQAAGYVRGGASAVGASIRVAAWRSDGVIRVVDVTAAQDTSTFAPGAPDVGLRIDEGREVFVRAALLGADTMALTDGESLHVVRLQGVSARIFTRREQVVQAAIVDVSARDESGFDVATRRFGAVEVERVGR